ncbi:MULTISPECIES: hypothetical protein [unclassified Methylobacterium]|uniref:hypothetical protein n=1 Tax=unclassified Methylobacterium TaxID=2615210 RepID=UPI0011C1EDD3|nr:MULTISPECIES: hypothetical protein [unclassified Methylobacterium]QEE37894.1 hypothetical protein FVA80_01905 [Methylobacterium sp. WL1]TXN59400.1 hypothetical protein FV241_02505 [Methylobacterium sp. WL2]
MTRAPFKSLTDLPTKLRNKIRCDGDETLDCWIWTATFIPARKRVKDGRGSLSNERGTPMVHAPELGYPTNACRVVYARACDAPLTAVPRLGRCIDDRCVSPHHVRDLGPVIKGTPHAAALRAMEAMIPKEPEAPHPRPQLVGDPNVEQPGETLRRLRPDTWMEIIHAEEECHLPPGSISPEVWADYVIWDETAPPKKED